MKSTNKKTGKKTKKEQYRKIEKEREASWPGLDTRLSNDTPRKQTEPRKAQKEPAKEKQRSD